MLGTQLDDPYAGAPPGAPTGYAAYDNTQSQDTATGPEDELLSTPAPSVGVPQASPIPPSAPLQPQQDGGAPAYNFKTLDEWAGKSPAAPPPPEQPGFLGSIKTGAEQFAGSEGKKLADMAASASRTIGRWTGTEAPQKFGDAIDDWSKANLENLGQTADVPDTVGEAYSKNGVSGVINWAANKATQGALGVAEILGMAAIDPLIPVGYFALTGANQEARKPDATPGSVASAAVESAVMAGALPVLGGASTAAKVIGPSAAGLLSKLSLPEAQSWLGRVATTGAEMAGYNLAGDVADKIPDVVAGRNFQMPTTGKMASDALAGLLTGGLVGAVRRGPGEQPAVTEEVPPTETKPEQLALPPPSPENRPEAPPGTVTEPMAGIPQPDRSTPQLALPGPTIPPLPGTPEAVRAAYTSTPPITTGYPVEPSRGVDPDVSLAVSTAINQPGTTRSAGAEPTPVRGPQQELPLTGGTSQGELPLARGVAPDVATALASTQQELPIPPTQQRLPFEAGTVPPVPARQPVPPEPARPAAIPAPAPEPRSPQMPPGGTGPAPEPAAAAPARVGLPEPAARAATTPEAAPGLSPGPAATVLAAARAAPERAATEAAPAVPRAQIEPTAAKGAGAAYTAEADHEVPGQYVAKDQAGNVRGLGDTPEQAIRMAQQREAERGAAIPAKPAEPVAAPAPSAEVSTLQPTPTQRAAKIREVVFGRRGEGAVAEEQPVPEKPVTVGEKLRQAQTERVQQAAPVVTTSLMAKGLARSLERQQQPSEAERMAAAGAPPREGGQVEVRAKSVTAKNKIYSDALHDVLNGDKTVEEMLSTAGQKQPGTVGRPRTHQNVISYLDQRIRQAETGNAREAALIEKMNRVEAQSVRQGLSDSERLEKIKPLKDQYDRLQEAQAVPHMERARIERTRLDELRQIRDEAQRIAPDQALAATTTAPSVEERAAAAAREIEGSQAVRDAEAAREAARQAGKTDEDILGMPHRYEEAGRTLNERLAASGVNDIFKRRLADDDRNFYTSTFGDYADTLTNHTSAKLATPHFVAITKRLREIIPDVPVTAFKSLVDAGIIKDQSHAGLSGGYLPRLDTIAMTPEGRYQAETLVHEGIHAATYKYLKNLHDKTLAGQELTPEEARHKGVVDAVFNATDRMLANERITGPEREALEHARSEDAGHELFSMYLTNPYLQSVASRTMAPRELRDAFKKLGYIAPRTTWQAVKDSIASFLHIPGYSRLRTGSILDHVLDPLAEVTDAAGRYRTGVDRESPGSARAQVINANERLASRRDNPASRITDPRLREAVTPMGERLLALPKILSRDEAADKLAAAASNTRGSLSRGAQKLLLKGSPTLDIMNHNKDTLKTLPGLRDALSSAWRASKNFRDNWQDNIKGWTQQLRRNPEVAKLMTEATYNKTYLGNDISFNQANAHLVGPALEEAQRLQERFKTLTPAQQQLYQNVRDYYRTVDSQQRFLRLQNLIASALPDADLATRQEILRHATTANSINSLAENPEALQGLAERFGERWQNSRDLVQRIGEVARMGHVQGDYFPLRRWGSWVVHYGDPKLGTYGVEYFERPAQAEARREELLKDPNLQDQVSDVLDREDRRNNAKFVPDAARADFERALVKRGVTGDAAEKAMEAFNRVALEAGARSEAALNRQRRAGVAGASTDQARALAQHFNSSASQAGYLQHGNDIANRYADLDREVKAMERDPGFTSGQKLTAKLVRDELRSREAPADYDDSSRMIGNIGRGFTTASFLYQMMRPAHLLVQLAEAQSNGLSHIGAKYGFAQSLATIARNTARLAPTFAGQSGSKMIKAMSGKLKAADWNESGYFKQKLIDAGADAKHMQAIHDGMVAQGMVDNSMAREATLMMQPGAFLKFADGLQNMTNTFAVAEHGMDMMNRWALAKSAYDLELRKSGDANKAIAAALDLASASMPTYTSWNRPSISRPGGGLGPLAPNIMQYKNYGLHMYARMGSLAVNAAKGKDRAEAVKTLAGLVATHSLLVGAASQFFPLPVSLALGAWDYLSGKPGPHNYENDLRRWVTSTFGPTAGMIFSKGALGAAGIDLNRSLKLTNMMELPEIRAFDSSAFKDITTGLLTGASGELAQQLGRGVDAALAGNWGQAAQQMLPRILADPYQAARWGEEGVTSQRGAQLMAPSEVTPSQQILKGLGFNPYDVSLARERAGAEVEFKAEAQRDHQNAVERFLSSGGKDMDLIRAYNQKYSGTGAPPITYSNLISQLRQHQQTAAAGTYGIRVPKKEVPYVRGLTQFQ